MDNTEKIRLTLVKQVSVWDHQRLNHQRKRSGICLCGLYQREAELSGGVRGLPVSIEMGKKETVGGTRWSIQNLEKQK